MTKVKVFNKNGTIMITSTFYLWLFLNFGLSTVQAKQAYNYLRNLWGHELWSQDLPNIKLQEFIAQTETIVFKATRKCFVTV